MSDFIDDFLAGLDKDKQQPRQQSGMVKILMSSKDNQGTVVFAPFMDTASKKFYVPLNGVREYHTTTSSFGEGNIEVWMKILPKDAYGALTEAQSALYDEVIGLFDQLDSELGDMKDKWSKIRFRSYSLFQGVIVNQLNAQGNKITDNLNKPALLIFPSKAPINALATAISAKIAAMGGSKEWIPAIFSPTDKGRDGVITISFVKPDKPGYDSSVGFEFNSSFAKVIDKENGFPEEVTKDFGDITEEFLGWQNGKATKFNEENFKELKDTFTVELKKLSVGNPASVEVENKNGMDPMLSQTPVSDGSTPVSTDTKIDDLPF